MKMKRPSDHLGYPIVELPESVAFSAESVIRFLIDKLVKQGLINPEHASRAACQVVTREPQGSTALATGIAVPHSKSEVLRPVGIVGRSRAAIPWQSPEDVAV